MAPGASQTMITFIRGQEKFNRTLNKDINCFERFVIIQGCLAVLHEEEKDLANLQAKRWLYCCARARELLRLHAGAPPYRKNHVVDLRSRRATGSCHVTEAPASPRDGAGRGDSLVATAEASSRARPAGEEGAGRGGAGQGLWDGLECGSGPVQRRRLAGLDPAALGREEEGA